MVSRQGGAIGIVVDWTCNLDLDVKHCKPKYDFHGLYGNPSETDKARASVGYNFRSVSASASVRLFLTSRSAFCDRTTELSSVLSRHLRDMQRPRTANHLSTNTAGVVWRYLISDPVSAVYPLSSFNLKPTCSNRSSFSSTLVQFPA